MKTILIVEDDPQVRRMMVRSLMNPEIEFVEAESGPQAVQLAQSKLPDLILLDLLLPGFDGFEVCNQLRLTAATAKIPVVLITGRGDSEDQARATELGAVDFISKPFSPQELQARVKAQLGSRHN